MGRRRDGEGGRRRACDKRREEEGGEKKNAERGKRNRREMKCKRESRIIRGVGTIEIILKVIWRKNALILTGLKNIRIIKNDINRNLEELFRAPRRD